MANWFILEIHCIYLVWTLSEEQQTQFCREEEVYARMWSKCNQKCNKKQGYNVTTLNKELAIETKILNTDLNYKSQFIAAKLDYKFKMWLLTDTPMSQLTYDKKFEWFLAHEMKCDLHHMDDKKFRHTGHRYESWHTSFPVIMNVLNKRENLELKKFLFADAGIHFEFTQEYREAKQDFEIYQLLNISRTEQNSNIEFDNFLTSAYETYKYTLGLEDDQDERMPLRDPFRM